MFPEQIRAARALLDLSQKALAKQAGISIATLNNIERRVQTDPKTSTVRAIQQALEALGIDFFVTPLGAMGVSLKPKLKKDRQATILIVDDSITDRTLYKAWLARAPEKNYKIVEADSAAQGVDVFLDSRPDCVILDFMMYGADGFQLLAALKRQQVVLPPIIFVTGMHSDLIKENAQAYGVHHYLNKQALTREKLIETVENALAR